MIAPGVASPALGFVLQNLFFLGRGRKGYVYRFGLKCAQPVSADRHYVWNRVTYEAPSLYAYLYVDLLSIPIRRVRVCKRPGCLHPYFTAGHLRQRFCSDECAAEGLREWKREWWKKHGSTWRQQRKNYPFSQTPAADFRMRKWKIQRRSVHVKTSTADELRSLRMRNLPHCIGPPQSPLCALLCLMT